MQECHRHWGKGRPPVYYTLPCLWTCRLLIFQCHFLTSMKCGRENPVQIHSRHVIFIMVLVWQQNPQGFPFARLVSFVVVVEHGTMAQKCVAKRYMTTAKVAVVYYNNVSELCLLCKLMLNLWYCVSFLLKMFGGYWNLYYFCIRFRLVKTTLSNERKSSLNNLHKDRDSSTRSDFNNVEIMG